ncbi:hypothetical protein CLAFUW4_14235 [Fulvia fulva]|uniref:Uncharacterized protein n=1 Tax=Passalora fulva TaxID=5499 RepID=A0A9Q8PLT7_PASFU|nr:uncharacterized protein CLAFUR5_14068 [Fulvia fulva]KAK4609392.1 hypothetical protein CLAFUR4_14238 [Fulvia fulva]KAK4609794.1 hypothetical protein CLAFUR0_14243 [Fulvia fulva]UJO24974.1 hypothetical protein CLAFUR5_14068 [Fulvia fulva]WPV22724.1 hypothetical protein CLAFUW4_14235 [Fulvia fulva]WPV37889.1 hypothetical protein CLAFUW7_14246 [Fulvia fulva]
MPSTHNERKERLTGRAIIFPGYWTGGPAFYPDLRKQKLEGSIEYGDMCQSFTTVTSNRDWEV